MDPKPASGQVESPSPFVIFVCLFAVMVLHVLTTHLGMFWDAGVYARTLHDWLNGKDPYSLSYSSLLFVYPPIFLWISAFFTSTLLRAIKLQHPIELSIAGIIASGDEDRGRERKSGAQLREIKPIYRIGGFDIGSSLRDSCPLPAAPRPQLAQFLDGSCAMCPVIAYPLRKRLAPKVFPDHGMTTAHSIANQVWRQGRLCLWLWLSFAHDLSSLYLGRTLSDFCTLILVCRRVFDDVASVGT